MQKLKLLIFVDPETQGLKFAFAPSSKSMMAVFFPFNKIIGIFPAVVHFLMDKNFPKNGSTFW